MKMLTAHNKLETVNMRLIMDEDTLFSKLDKFTESSTEGFNGIRGTVKQESMRQFDDKYFF